MKVKKLIAKCFLVAGIASFLVGLSNNASAGGFQLFEQNAVNMGDFGAGGAAIAEDASTAYFNPAGLVRICHQQLVASTDVVITDFKFNGTDTWSSNLPEAFAPPPITLPTLRPVQGGDTNFVPAIHYAAPINNCLTLGFSVGSPFGLETNYAERSNLRYSATHTQLRTIDFGPSFGLKFNNHFSVGAGLDIAKIDVIFNSVAGIPPMGSQLDTLSRNTASAWSYGWHGGILYQFNPCTRIGLAYHSQLNFDVNGKSKFMGPLANPLALEQANPQRGFLESNLTAVAHLPPWTNLSIYHDFNERWGVDGSVVFTQWNKFNRNLILHHVQAVNLDTDPVSPSFLQFLPEQIDPVVPQHFRNTWRVAVGGIYRPTRCFLVRAGLGYDQTPVNNRDRNLRLPDGDRYAVAVGARYHIAKPVYVDAGWTHLFIRDVGINNKTVTGIQNADINGTVKSHADLVGGQVTWNFT